MIPLVDLNAQHTKLRVKIAEAFERVFEGSQFIMGPEVQGFEDELAEALGVGHVIGVASGTAALHLTLVALGVGEHRDVIVIDGIGMEQTEHAPGLQPVL